MTLEEQVLHAWKEWGIRVLVLLSLAIQVLLLVLAEFRRRVDSGVLRAFVWSAYMLADSTAIYVLGHMSVTSRSPEHRLMAFWAPFLLLHLGGQDNITAYSIEDNRLWLRHLQNLVVQVAAAAYVLYVSSMLDSRSLLRPATIILFLVGAAKYGERVWALWRADSTPLGNKYMSFESTNRVSFGAEIVDLLSNRGWEASTYIAHLLLDIPRDLMNGPLPQLPHIYFWTFHNEVYRIAERQLSLMHDVLYTKAELQHRWCGICIRVISSLAAIGAFLLFLVVDYHQKESYNKVDVAVTYILLAGALVLETTSLLAGIFSSWTCFLLVKWRFKQDSREVMEHQIEVLPGRCTIWRVVASVYRLIHAGNWRRRHGGQSSSGRQSDARSHTVMARARELYERMGWQAENIKLDESILSWHVATEIYLRWYTERQQETATGSRWEEGHRPLGYRAEAVKDLSNYMLFLLATRDYMLSPTASRIAYVEACYALTALEYSSAEELITLLRRWGDSLDRNNGAEIDFPFTTNTTGNRRLALIHSTTLRTGAQLGAKLIERGLQESRAADSLGLLKEVWLEMLFYAACECSGYSHAKQLSYGGELVTIASILVKYTALHIKISVKLLNS
ncbi:hypothetical protein HU200_013348 [Digitaria exilis]|uniref:DUF4220 domain-containing protein n=1 Tax=Digitaria exilis TaxID=1010633 RepID=A0A835FDE3_9POAL|nr:hypothetical protein HU200_013348 [Digitaria exilis]